MDLKTRVKGVVTFKSFENSEGRKELRYVCCDGFEFPVPLDDTVGALFTKEDKGLLFMRWIKGHMELIEAAK